MTRPYVEWLQVKNLWCIKDVELKLTPFHALIGPNDSGKSTLLRALQSFGAGAYPRLEPMRGSGTLAATVRGERVESVSRSAADHLGRTIAPLDQVQLLKPDPAKARTSSPLIPSNKPMTFTDIGGTGLAGVYDALSGRENDHWVALRTSFVEKFPTVKALEIQNADSHTKHLGALLRDGRRITANEMSEGMIYWLMFSALQFADRPGILLVEEPENGLHPARIREVMALLRGISEHTQVVIATHSPLVINEMRDDEVSIVTRTVEDGTKVRPIRDTPNFAQRRKTYELGELWLSYADGVDEAPLFAPPAKSAG